MPKSLALNLVAIAQAEVGTREGKLNNTGARIVEYQKATWLKPDAWSWCAAFVAWCMREWLNDIDVRTALRVLKIDTWRCHDASAFGWEKWAKIRGLKVLPDTDIAKAGDIVIFDFSHIGIVAEDQLSPAHNIKTIEGNTNSKGDRDSNSGDGVWQKSRNPALVKCYIRLL